MVEKIKLICGDAGNLKSLESISNNPNFIFKNDPNFSTIVLFNDNGQKINVNSWLECANYVNGGWISENYDSINGEFLIFLSLIIAITMFTIFTNIRKVRDQD